MTRGQGPSAHMPSTSRRWDRSRPTSRHAMCVCVCELRLLPRPCPCGAPGGVLDPLTPQGCTPRTPRSAVRPHLEELQHVVCVGCVCGAYIVAEEEEEEEVIRTCSSGGSTRLARPTNKHSDATHEYTVSTTPSLHLCSMYSTPVTAVTPSVQPSELISAPLSLVVTESAPCVAWHPRRERRRSALVWLTHPPPARSRYHRLPS